MNRKILSIIFTLSLVLTLLLSACNRNENSTEIVSLIETQTKQSTETPTATPPETELLTIIETAPTTEDLDITETSLKNEAVRLEALEPLSVSDKMKWIPVKYSQYQIDNQEIEHQDGLYFETDDVDKIKRDPTKMYYFGNNTPTKEIQYSLMGQYVYLEFVAALTHEDRNINNPCVISLLVDGVAQELNKNGDASLRIGVGDLPHSICLDITGCNVLTIQIRPNGIFTDTPAIHRLLLADFYLHTEEPIEVEQEAPIAIEASTEVPSATTEQIAEQNPGKQILIGSEAINYETNSYVGGWGYNDWVSGDHWYSPPKYKYYAICDQAWVEGNSIGFKEGGSITGYEIQRFSNRNDKSSYGTITLCLDKKYGSISGALTAKNGNRNCRMTIYLDDIRYDSYDGGDFKKIITIDTTGVQTIEFAFAGGNSWSGQTWITFSDIEVAPIQ